jgi:Holliday junction resolvase
MHEKDIVTAIMRYLKTVPDCFAWKTHGGMYGVAGLPDIVACVGGRFVAFEVKTPTGKLTKLQEITIQKIRAAKGEACMVTSVEEVQTILRHGGGGVSENRMALP